MKKYLFLSLLFLLTFPLVSSGWTADLDSNLIAWWKFDNNNSFGTSVTGVRNWTQAGNISSGEICKFNECLYNHNNFTSNYLSQSEFISSAVYSSGTFAGWFKANDDSDGVLIGSRGIVGSNTYWSLGTNTSYAFFSAIENNNNQSNIIIQKNKYYYIAMVWNATGTKVYINNTIVTQHPNSRPITGGTTDFLTRNYNPADSNNVNVTLDEFGFWNSALNTTQLTFLFNNNTGCYYQNCPEGYVYLKSPVNNSFKIGNVTFNTTINLNNIVNATFHLWNDNDLLINKTTNLLTGNLNNTNWTVTLTSGNNLKWNVLACNQQNNCFFALQNNTLFNNINFNSVQYNLNTTSFSSETFSLNLTYMSNIYTTITGNLIYNNTRYSSTKTGNGDNLLFSNSLSIPAVSSQINKSFYWEILLANSTYSIYINTSSYNQTINTLSLDDCSVHTNLIVNYTLYDEQTRTKLNAPTYNVTSYLNLLIGNSLLTEYINISFNKTGVNGIKVCSANALGSSYRMDSTIRYSANEYAVEYYNIQNYTLSNSSARLEIDLYDLLLTDSQEFLITVRDDNLIPIRDALVRIDRQYLSINSFLVVEQPKTDTDGRTIAHFVLSDEVYNVYVLKNGELLATFTNVRAYCDNQAIGDCKLNLKTSSTSIRLDSFTSINGIVYAPFYNTTTRVFSVDFNVLSGNAETLQLNITGWNARLNNTICSTSLTSASGSLQCTIPDSFGNGTAYYSISIPASDSSEIIQTIRGLFDIGGSDTTTLKTSRFFFAFLLILMLPLMALGSGSMVIIMFIGGFIIAGTMLFISGDVFGSLAPLAWLIIAGGILFWKLNSIENK